jgi:hypothetical protein
MANSKIRVSPSVNFYEQDLTFNPQRQFALTKLMIMGEFEYGSAFDITKVSNYNEFSAKFGTLNPCKYKNTNQLKFQGAYTAKQFLQESNELYVCRVLGLSGYDAGDLWAITFGAAVDTNTIVEGSSSTFTGEIQYANGELVSGTFSNSIIQDMFDSGILDADVLGGYNLATGDTLTYNSIDGFVSSCDGNFTSSRFDAVVVGRDDHYICLSGTSTSGGYVYQSSVTETCSVQFTAGTQTIGSTLRITVTTPIVIINQNTSEVEPVSSGIIVIKGGTITHNVDDSITIVNGTITLPNGDILNGTLYKICELGSNLVEYDCEGINGTGYTLVTGTTVVNVPVFQSGSTTTEIQVPSGIVTLQFSGSTTDLTATALTEYENKIVCGLRSVASYNGNEELTFRVKNTNLLIEPLVSGQVILPYDDFRLTGTDTNGVEFTYIVSLDKRKSNYINKVFGARPNCCDSNSPLYISELYQTMFDNLVAQNKIYCIKPTICHNTSLWNYKQQYQGAETPYLVSELRGNKVVRLFKFLTLGDGESANRYIKVSITNIRPDRRLFDVLVRSYYDTDKNPVILEQFANCSLDVQSNNYVARLIGGTSVNDVYPQVSMYMSVAIDATCVYDAFPSGFEGYPVVDYGECATAPMIQYKTKYDSTDRVRYEFLGLNSNDGFDQDLFDYHGQPAVNTLVFSGTTNGFHLDKDASACVVDGVGTLSFEVGENEFRNDADLEGTSYAKLNSRKFTVAFYGGFDGWDIHRLNTGNRSVGDQYSVKGTNGILGLASSAFDTYVLEDFDGEFATVINSDYYAYLKGIRAIANPEAVKYNLVVTPNINTFENSDLVEEMIEMLEEVRCDAFYIVDTPTRDADGIPYSAAFVADRLDGLFSTSFAATYVYDGIFNDTENNTYVYVPASVDLPRIYAINDRIGKVWFAPANKTRGSSAFVNVVKNPTQNERDVLYEGRINSMWRDGGIVTSWGNKTLQAEETVLDRINVRRLMIYIRQLLSDVSVTLLFEQNDDTIRRQFESLVNPILADIRRERGIINFRIELDKSARAFETNQLNGKIFIQPTLALEQINIGFTLTNSSAFFDNV